MYQAGLRFFRGLLGMPSAPVRSSAPHASGTQAISKHSQRVKCIADWKDLLEQEGACSAMCVTAITSKSPEAAYEASLRDFTPPTLAQYFRCVRVFLAFARALDVLVGDLQLVRIVNLMHACDTSHTEDRTSVRISPKPMLKALSWLARVGQIHSLIAPPSPQQNRERKEALPLPLAVLAAWEQKVCSADCTTGLRIALGSFLLAAHTSMRFGDIQRIRARHQPHSACLARFTLGNQNNQKRAALGLHALRVNRSGRKILLGSFLASQFHS